MSITIFKYLYNMGVIDISDKLSALTEKRTKEKEQEMFDSMRKIIVGCVYKIDDYETLRQLYSICLDKIVK